MRGRYFIRIWDVSLHSAVVVQSDGECEVQGRDQIEPGDSLPYWIDEQDLPVHDEAVIERLEKALEE